MNKLKIIAQGLLIIWFGLIFTAQSECSSPEDNDGDGYPAGQDCNDSNNKVHPGAQELCDDIDHDCSDQLTPCTLHLEFTEASDKNWFELEKLGSSCQDQGISDGLLTIDCPDNNDAIYWVKFDISNASRIEVVVNMGSKNWYDGGPRIGIDFGSGTSGAWGPSNGYAFYYTDPLDSAQGGQCSFGDACPSIMKNAASILDLENAQTFPDTGYGLTATMSSSETKFEIEDGGGTVFTLNSGDTSIRSGRVGLHCAEAICQFDLFELNVE